VVLPVCFHGGDFGVGFWPTKKPRKGLILFCNMDWLRGLATYETDIRCKYLFRKERLLVTLASRIFIVPFLLLSALGGQIAARCLIRSDRTISKEILDDLTQS
jgi:hypothetical protein